MKRTFDYDTAFSRNIGWVTREEQQILRSKRVAIAGMGGVGGSHLLTLSRLGIGAFHIADFDVFDLANFNRQAGAMSSTVGRHKIEVLANFAHDINPQAKITSFPEGVTSANLQGFLKGVDVYVDGLDFFALDIRRQVFAACAAAHIPAVTAAPIGMGAAVLNFLPGHSSFEEYFRLEGHNEQEQLLRFLVGLAPAMLQRGYLVAPHAVDLVRHRVPSTPMACELCAGLAATQVLKILLHRGPLVVAPHGLHIDAYRNKLVLTRRPRGNRHPLQRLALMMARRQFNQPRSAPHGEYTQPLSTIERLLDLARWAPSGDNTQPWRFEIVDNRHVVVHGHDTRDHCIYDLQGRASQLALGALLESITIAATGEGLCANIQRRGHMPDNRPTFDVHFTDEISQESDPLLPYLPLRSTQRRPMQRRPLSAYERHTLENTLPQGYQILWFTGSTKLSMAALMYANAGLRLTLPEAYEVHRRVIQWHARFSHDRIPDQAVGLDPLTTRVMQWILKDWSRVRFVNRYLAGTLLPRLQLEVIPALACAAHFVILAQHPPEQMDDYLEAGRAVQRYWLSATRLGLYLQPEVTPLIFASYVRKGLPFTREPRSLQRAVQLTARLERMLGRETGRRAIFMGRIGAGPAPTARSLRLDLNQLFELIPSGTNPET